MLTDLVTRIAPTPSGYLHLGNAFSFILTWLHARQRDGRIVLRIDDLDRARKRPEYVEDIFQSLDWLGLSYDLGPSGPEDFEANYSQFHRMSEYKSAFEHLNRRRTLVRLSLHPIGDSEYGRRPAPSDCLSRDIPLTSADTCWRMATEPGIETWVDVNDHDYNIEIHATSRDPIVRRKDGLPAYHLASIVDDQFFGVNYIVRGVDLVPSTAIQRWLSRQLPNTSFHRSKLLHHALVLAPDGTKLSKSAGANSLAELRKSNDTPEILYEQLSPYFGLAKPVRSLSELQQAWLETNHDA